MYQYYLNHVFFMLALTCSELFTFKIFYLENLGQDHGARHLQWSHWWQISTSIKVIICTFALSLFLRFNVLNVWSWKFSQGHRVQHSQWQHLMANINVFKRHKSDVFATSYHFPNSSISNCDFGKIGQGQDVQHPQRCNLMANTWLIRYQQ